MIQCMADGARTVLGNVAAGYTCLPLKPGPLTRISRPLATVATLRSNDAPAVACLGQTQTAGTKLLITHKFKNNTKSY